MTIENDRPGDLDQLALLCTGSDYWNTHVDESRGVRCIRMADGPHGLRVQDDDSPDHLGLGRSLPATCFPPAVALASSWDAELVAEVGGAIAVEARAQGVDVVLGPGLNMKRSPLCGRNFEYYSEDPLLAGVLAGAMVRGIQSKGVAATLKHFALNNQETERMRVSADIDPRPLHEIYLRAFEIAVREGEPWMVMSSYNAINGEYASQSKWLLTDILRDEWGFDGLVVSDWGGVYDPVAAVAAGLDLRMPGSATNEKVLQAARGGKLDVVVLERVAARLRQLGERTASIVPAPKADVATNHALCRRAAAESAVLLHNKRGLLPLDVTSVKSVALIGELARTPRYQGAGSSAVNPTRLVSALEALGDAMSDVRFEAGYRLDGVADDTLRAAAVEAARAADTVVMVLGLPAVDEAEGHDRTSIELPAVQVDLLRAVSAVSSRVVVVLSNGSVVTTAGWRDQCGALVEFWLTGQAHGEAIVDVLTGVVNPAGRLAETIPLRIEDTPAYIDFPGEGLHVRYGEGLYIGYRWYDARKMPVDYPFGHGLSFTQFDYDDLVIDRHDASDPIAFTASITVANVGDRDGAEVVQLYVAAPSGVLRMPEQELRAFAKVRVAAGRSERVTIAVPRNRLRHFHPQAGWVETGGEVAVLIGASSRDVRLRSTLDLPNKPLSEPLTMWSPLGHWFAHPQAGPKLNAVIDANGGMRGRLGDLLADPAGRDSILGIPLASIMQFPRIPFSEQDLANIMAAIDPRP